MWIWWQFNALTLWPWHLAFQCIPVNSWWMLLAICTKFGKVWSGNDELATILKSFNRTERTVTTKWSLYQHSFIPLARKKACDKNEQRPLYYENRNGHQANLVYKTICKDLALWLQWSSTLKWAYCVLYQWLSCVTCRCDMVTLSIITDLKPSYFLVQANYKCTSFGQESRHHLWSLVDRYAHMVHWNFPY